MQLAASECRRFGDLIAGLSEDEWRLPTDCTEWDVHDVAAHVLAVTERSATVVRNLATFATAAPAARWRSRPAVDVVNEREVARRRNLSSRRLVMRFDRAVPPALRRRQTLPAMVGRLRVRTHVGPRSVRFLYDTLFTRDMWMHRIDIARATNRDMKLTADHDGAIVADLVAGWSRHHDLPLTLDLEGAAGGRFEVNGGGAPHAADAIRFARFLAGRVDLQDLPRGAVMF